MTKRQAGQVAALLVLPAICFVIIRAISGDSYLPISVSYLILLAIMPFVDLEAFVLLPTLRKLRDTQNEVRRIFNFASAQNTQHGIETTTGIILKDQNVRLAARFEYLLAESARAIAAVREEMIKIILINVFLIVFLVILTSNQPSAPPAAALNGKKQGDVASSVDVRVSAQTRLALSYVAVVLQLVWMGQVLFHYRQKNVETVTQANLSTEHPQEASLTTPALPAGH